MKNSIQKKCPKCGKLLTAENILNDPDILPIGMCFDNDDVRQNIYMFNHAVEGCNTTFSIPVEHFSAYVQDTDKSTRLADTELCKHHCLTSMDMSLCDQPCFFVPYRRLLLQMMKAKKTGCQITLSNAY